MVWTAGRVHIATLPQVCQVFHFVSVEVSRQVQLLTSYNGYLAALQQILCNNRCQSADQVASAINYNGLKRKIETISKTTLCTHTNWRLCSNAAQTCTRPSASTGINKNLCTYARSWTQPVALSILDCNSQISALETATTG